MKLALSIVTTHRYFFQIQNQVPLILYLICLSSFASHHLARQSTFFRSIISYITWAKFLLDVYFPDRAISQFHPGYIDWFFLQSIALSSNYLQIHNSSCLFSLCFSSLVSCFHNFKFCFNYLDLLALSL